jgi:hypothetical protein
MEMYRIAGVAALVALCAGAVVAGPLKLKPANPQPGSVSDGLAVDYAFPDDVKSLRDAYIALGIGAQPGEPLVDFDYLSSESEPYALTSGQEARVAARIKGYLRFDAPGTYTLDIYSNDGLELSIGGREVAKVDEKRGCDPIGAVEVSVPDAGWYELEALYWQRKGGSCLIVEWAEDGGELKTVPATAFGHQ